MLARASLTCADPLRRRAASEARPSLASAHAGRPHLRSRRGLRQTSAGPRAAPRPCGRVRRSSWRTCPSTACSIWRAGFREALDIGVEGLRRRSGAAESSLPANSPARSSKIDEAELTMFATSVPIWAWPSASLRLWPRRPRRCRNAPPPGAGCRHRRRARRRGAPHRAGRRTRWRGLRAWSTSN